MRLNLWPDKRTARDGVRLGWLLANVIKVSMVANLDNVHFFDKTTEKAIR